jgi:hypothetical protein
MSAAADKDVDKDATQPTREPAGKVEFDSRGNSVWRWARDVLESTSVLLKRLENHDLALEPTQKVPIMKKGGQRTPANSKAEARAPAPADPKPRHPALREERRKDTGGGFDPYNSR